MNVLDVGTVDISTMLEDKLLEEEEGALVVHMLSDLHS